MRSAKWGLMTLLCANIHWSFTKAMAQSDDSEEEAGVQQNELEGFGLTPKSKSSVNKNKKNSTGRDKKELNKPQKSEAGRPSAKARKNRGEVKKANSPQSPFAVGVELGYEARYGNALTLHYSFNDLFDLHAGLGYNLSGPKIGGGADFLLGLGQSIGLLFGGAFVVSAGRKGEATLDANFTDENSQTTVIKATKEYTVSPAQYFNISAGSFWKMTQSIRLVGLVGYNVVIGGNNVSFTDESVKYDKEVEVLNQRNADSDFREKAEKDVQTGGLGGSLGMIVTF